MANSLPKAKRVNSGPNGLVYALVAIVVLLGVAVGVLLMSDGLFTAEPQSDAERDYQVLLESLEENPEDPAVLMTLAEAEFALGKDEDAFKHAAAAVKFGGDAPAFRLRYAGLLVQAGQEEKARVLVEEEIALETPGDAEPFFLLAQIDRQTGDVDAAIVNIEKGLKIAPTAADMMILYADLLAESGDKDAAIAQYKKALKFLPGDERAEEGLKALGVTPPSADSTGSPHGTAPSE